MKLISQLKPNDRIMVILSDGNTIHGTIQKPTVRNKYGYFVEVLVDAENRVWNINLQKLKWVVLND